MIEILILLVLIVVNGIFAMTEIALVSARKSKLQQLAEKGDVAAKKAFELSKNPNSFLSTVQIGITFIGIFAGAFGGDTIAHSISEVISFVPVIGIYSDNIALLVVVLFITYLSLVIGEIVPKRIALLYPERIAIFMAPIIQSFSFFSAPIIQMLSVSTDWVLGIFKIKKSSEIPITEEEVKMLIREGARIGVFNLAERDIVERTFRLSDKKVNMLMTPRKEIQWLDISGNKSDIRKIISQHSFSYFPVCKKDLDTVVGIVRTKELLSHYFVNDSLDIESLMNKVIFIPETMKAIKVLELFKKSGIHVAMVVNEYGRIEGLLSITDILVSIIGDIPTADEPEESSISKRKDGTYLVDGLLSIDKFKDYFHLKSLHKEDQSLFQTVGGYIMHYCGRIPKIGYSFESSGLRFEVVDMDRTRVDKILIKKL